MKKAAGRFCELRRSPFGGACELDHKRKLVRILLRKVPQAGIDYTKSRVYGATLVSTSFSAKSGRRGGNQHGRLSRS
jgi:hypothetical protein